MTSFNERLRAAMLSDAEAAENKRLRAAPATAPSQLQCVLAAWIPPEREGEFHHEHESITASRTPMAGWVPVYRHLPATATSQPAWQDAPTVPGLWLNSVFMKVEDVEQWHIDCQLHLECARWYGPIPPDGDKP